MEKCQSGNDTTMNISEQEPKIRNIKCNFQIIKKKIGGKYIKTLRFVGKTQKNIEKTNKKKIKKKGKPRKIGLKAARTREVR